jgi:hypothetical protein
VASEEDVRRIALSLPGAVEVSYNHLPGFRVRRQLFARIHEQPDALFVKCAGIDERNDLVRSAPDKFFTVRHYDGYPGFLVRISMVDAGELTELLTESWRLTAPARLIAQYDAGCDGGAGKPGRQPLRPAAALRRYEVTGC